MSTPPVRRGRGQRAGLDRAAIVAAARTLSPADITMQAVADRMGVDRKALHHHVSSLDALLELVAEEVFLEHMGGLRIPADATWQHACRAFAQGARAALVASGVLAAHFRTSSQVTMAAVRPAEIVLERLIDAGFEEQDAGRALLLLTTIGIGFAREEITATKDGGHPQIGQFRDLLSRTEATELGVLRRLDSSGFDAYGDAQFAFDIDIVVSALGARLTSPRE